MDKKVSIEHFSFESREVYDKAEKEYAFILQIQNNVDLTVGKNALKVYNKAVSDKMFETAVGYCFLNELRKIIVETGAVPEEALEDIPVKEPAHKPQDVISERSMGENRFRRMYEGQKLLNKKLKIGLITLLVLLAGFVAINFKFEYSIFTYFTNYKANMEEELIDKYEYWQTDLEEREQKLESQEEVK